MEDPRRPRTREERSTQLIAYGISGLVGLGLFVYSSADMAVHLLGHRFAFFDLYLQQYNHTPLAPLSYSILAAGLGFGAGMAFTGVRLARRAYRSPHLIQ